jgi:hypothetical protein
VNERIRKLYQQAHMVREYPVDDPMRGGNPPTVYWGGEESAKKFAELIVSECIRMCDVAAVGYKEHGDIKEANGCVLARKYIAEHLGVEL